ncbi:hypothetical protein [Brevibacillus sp. MCWH]|uniref:hypothetical protein n=1 Tax=Brevibacillus sp. MCWH TaxID=2508871 RepID=UPI00149160F8|nr:hypothetical protein [Brevibacillus sp. MCWH]NNV04576.1 hypothetical protein [Brevibacillus sp. MCWH]
MKVGNFQPIILGILTLIFTLSMSWESETTLKAVIPDTTDYAFDTLKNWKAGENNTKEIFIKVT